jgi:hypothetical protein
MKIYFEKVSNDDMIPKDGKTYYWLNKRNYQIIEESVLEKALKMYEANKKILGKY